MTSLELCLFIDESGDFETERGEWLIAGLLCRGGISEVESCLADVFSRQVTAGTLPPLSECHLTEFRRINGDGEANRITELVFQTVFSGCAHLQPLLAVAVNAEKRRAGSAEQTYRMGLLDIIALIEASIEESEVISSLYVQVATRTKDGERLTTLERLKEDARSSLQDALEMGLASRGLLNSFNSNALQLRLRPASQSWGIAVADFLANTVYNRRHPFQANLLAGWAEKNLLAEFRSCGGYEERRARVAERERDYISALSRWSLHGIDRSVSHSESLERVWSKVLQKTGTTGPLASVESLIERLARSASPRKEIDALLALEGPLENALRNSGHDGHQLLFRLRNRLLLLGNQTGCSDLSTSLIRKQQELLPRLLADAETLPLIMQFGALTVESAINDLDFAAALTRADAHYRFVEDFLAAWQLFIGNSSHPLPKWQLRAAGTLARALAMNVGAGDTTVAARVERLLDGTLSATQHDRAVGGRTVRRSHQLPHGNEPIP